MPEGALVADAASGNLILANEQTRQILRHAYELNDDLEAYEQQVPFQGYRPNGQPYAADEYPLVRSLRTGEAIAHEEMELRYPDGSRILIDVNASPIFDSQGQIAAAVAVFQDITDRKHAEAQLRESQHFVQQMAETTPGILYVYDLLEQRNIYVNRQVTVLLGYATEQVQAMAANRLPTLMHPEDFARVPAHLAQFQSARDGEIFELEYRMQGADGKWQWFHTREVVFSRAADGLPRRILGIAQEITDRKQTEVALRESEERFRTLADNISQFAWMADESGWIFWYNQRWFDYTGTTLEEMQGWGWQQVHHPDHVERVVEKISRCFEIGELWEDTFPLRGKDGQYRWFLSRAIPIRNEQGKVLRWFGTNTDITELRQTEIALKQATERLNLALKSVPIILFNQDRALRYTWVYSPAVDCLVEEVIGRQDGDFVSPKSAARLTRLKQQVLDTGAGLREEVKVVKDGQTTYYDLIIDPIWEAKNSVVGITCAAVDISDRKQAEAALCRSEARLRMAIESAQLGTWDWNLVTNKLTWDAGCKAMFGLPPEAETSIEVFLERLHPDDRDRVRQVMQESLSPASGGNYDVEYRTLGIQDGMERWIAAKGQAYFDAAGNPRRFIGTVLDITERKQAEAQRERLLEREQAAREAAERANRIKDEFLAILSHELRSPLNPILGWSRLLQTRKFDEAKTAEALATIERNARLQTELIDDLLDVAKILRGKLSLNMASVNLSVVIESAIDTVKTAAVAKSIRLHPVLPNIGQVSGDAVRLQQIIWNLLSNAIKFTPDGGRVDIQFQRVGDRAEITVRDTGKGISPGFLPHIFESFRQEDASTNRKYGGLGLGLAIVRQLVEAHGGTIQAESPGEGRGATFTIRLPLLKAESAVSQTDELLQQELDLAGIRVLAVDDKPDARELLAALLTQYGAEVTIAASAAEVLATLESFQPDVFVIDIGMPDVDGYALIQQIRALPPEKGGQIPAIALTAYARAEDRQRALNSGYQRHVTKPIEPEQFLQAVVALASKSTKPSQEPK